MSATTTTTTTTTAANTPAPTPAPLSRDDLRAAIFSAQNRKPASTIVDFFGQKIELRQPRVNEASTLAEEGKIAMVTLLIRFAYVPGTDQKLFEESDYDMLATMPLTEDMRRILNYIMNITGMNLDEAAKN